MGRQRRWIRERVPAGTWDHMDPAIGSNVPLFGRWKVVKQRVVLRKKEKRRDAYQREQRSELKGQPLLIKICAARALRPRQKKFTRKKHRRT